MSIPGILFDYGGKLLGDAIGKSVAEKAGQQAGDLLGGGTEETTKFIGDGPVNYAMEHSPQEYARKKTSDMANDAIMSSLHHLPGIRQILNGVDDVIDTIPANLKRSGEVYEDVTTNRMKLPESIKNHFGTEDLKTHNIGLKQLRDMNFKVSPQEQKITRNLVKSQRKVFDILHDTEELIKKGDFTEDEIKQIHSDMEDKVTKAYTKKRDGLNYHEGLNKQNKNMINHIYDYPKPGNIVTKTQRENVFRAIEKDLKTHTSGGLRTKLPKYRDLSGTSFPFTEAHQKSIKFLLDTETDIGTGKIYIDESGRLKMVGSDNTEAKISIPDSRSTPGFLSTSEQLADVVANSDRIPQETKDMLLKDFKKVNIGKKTLQRTQNGILKTIHRGEVGLDRLAKSPKLNPDFVRNADSKKAYAQLQEQLKLSGIDDLKASEVVNPTDIFDNPRKPYNTYLKKPDLAEGLKKFRVETKAPRITNTQQKSLENITGLGQDGLDNENILIHWNTLKQAGLVGDLDKLAKSGVDIRSPNKNMALKYKKSLEGKKDLTADEKGWLEHVDLSGVDYNDGKITGDESRAGFTRFQAKETAQNIESTKAPAKITENKPVGIFDITKPEPVQTKTRASTITIPKTTEQLTSDVKEFTGKSRTIKETPEEKGTRELAERHERIRLETEAKNKIKLDKDKKAQIDKRQE